MSHFTTCSPHMLRRAARGPSHEPSSPPAPSVAWSFRLPSAPSQRHQPTDLLLANLASPPLFSSLVPVTRSSLLTAANLQWSGCGGENQCYQKSVCILTKKMEVCTIKKGEHCRKVHDQTVTWCKSSVECCLQQQTVWTMNRKKH